MAAVRPARSTAAPGCRLVLPSAAFARGRARGRWRRAGLSTPQIPAHSSAGAGAQSRHRPCSSAARGSPFSRDGPRAVEQGRAGAAAGAHLSRGPQGHGGPEGANVEARKDAWRALRANWAAWAARARRWRRLFTESARGLGGRSGTTVASSPWRLGGWRTTRTWWTRSQQANSPWVRGASPAGGASGRLTRGRRQTRASKPGPLRRTFRCATSGTASSSPGWWPRTASSTRRSTSTPPRAPSCNSGRMVRPGRRPGGERPRCGAQSRVLTGCPPFCARSRARGRHGGSKGRGAARARDRRAGRLSGGRAPRQRATSCQTAGSGSCGGGDPIAVARSAKRGRKGGGGCGRASCPHARAERGQGQR